MKIVLDRTKDVLGQVRRLERNQVLVGIPSDHAGRKDEPITNAAIGYIQEFGSPEANIPARPFLIPGAASVRDAASKRMQAGAKAALAGNEQAADQALMGVGLMAQNAVRAKITEGVPPALAPATIAARKARGRTGTVPLIDTGQLRNSITFVIRPKG